MYYDALLTKSSSIMQLNKTLQILVRKPFDVQIWVTSGEVDVIWIYFFKQSEQYEAQKNRIE